MYVWVIPEHTVEFPVIVGVGSGFTVTEYCAVVCEHPLDVTVSVTLTVPLLDAIVRVSVFETNPPVAVAPATFTVQA